MIFGQIRVQRSEGCWRIPLVLALAFAFLTGKFNQKEIDRGDLAFVASIAFPLRRVQAKR